MSYVSATGLRPSPAQVPGATSSVVRLPGSQQPTHGFAALWLRLASGPAQPATHLSPACPAKAPAHLSACQSLGRLPAFQQAQPSLPRSGLSNVSETGLRPTTSLTCLRLVSSYASYQACLTCPSPPVRLPKQLSPG